MSLSKRIEWHRSTVTSARPWPPRLAARCSGVALSSSLTLTNWAKPLPSFEGPPRRNPRCWPLVRTTSCSTSSTGSMPTRPPVTSTLGMGAAVLSLKCRPRIEAGISPSSWGEAWCSRRGWQVLRRWSWSLSLSEERDR